jgi:hypothetical protein
MNPAAPLSREAIKAMDSREYEERRAEVMRWTAAGAVDGQPAPPGPHVRPDGHEFTRQEIAGMTVADLVLNRPAIVKQVAEHGPLPTGT